MASKRSRKRIGQVNVSETACMPLSLRNSLNFIPDGRQLLRTPPSKNHNTPIIQKSEQATNATAESIIKNEYDVQPVKEGSVPSRLEHVKEERRYSASPASEAGHVDIDSFIQGMQGYKWTEADLEFVHHARQQKRVLELQQQLSEVQKVLKDKAKWLDLARTTRDQLQTELSKTPACDVMLKLCQDVLQRSQPAAEQDTLEGVALVGVALGDDLLEARKLLSQLRLVDVEHALHTEVAEVTWLYKELDKARELREAEEQTMKEMEKCQSKIIAVEENVKALKMALKGSWLSEEEKPLKAARPQENTCKASRTVKARTTSDSHKAQKEKATKEKTRKETKTCPDGKRKPTEQRLHSAKIEVGGALEKVAKAPKTTKCSTVAVQKAQKETDQKETAQKEKPSKKNISSFKKSPAGPGNAHKAAKPLKAVVSPKPSESHAVLPRRSKRIAMKNQGQPAAVLPQRAHPR